LAAIASSISASASAGLVPLSTRDSCIFGLAALESSFIARPIASRSWPDRADLPPRHQAPSGPCSRAPHPGGLVAPSHEVSEFPLAKHSFYQHRQVIGLIAIALAGGPGLALGRLGVTQLKIHFGKTRMQNRILWRLADRVAQLDLGGSEISLYDVLVCLPDRGC